MPRRTPRGNTHWGQRYFGLIAEIFYTDTSAARKHKAFPLNGRGRIGNAQVGTIVPKRSGKTVRKIIIYCAYDYNSGTAWFDNISLRQEPVQTYTYNEKGNLSRSDTDGHQNGKLRL